MGLVSGLVIGVAGLYYASSMVSNGHDVAGALIGSVDLVALVSVFVYGKRRNSTNKKATLPSKQLDLGKDKATGSSDKNA